MLLPVDTKAIVSFLHELKAYNKKIKKPHMDQSHMKLLERSESQNFDLQEPKRILVI